MLKRGYVCPLRQEKLLGADFVTYGYKPTFARKLIRKFARAFIYLFRLNGRSIWSNEVSQSLDLVATTQLNGERFHFRTGNGRLLWRVRTFPYEEPLMARWISTIIPSDIVLDIGANCGLYSTAFAKQASIVYACELDPMNIGLIKENAFLNGVHERVVILPFACGADDSALDVFFRDLIPGDALQSMYQPQILSTRLGEFPHKGPVLVLSLDDLWDRARFQRPTKIKIDVDGNEETVLKGIRRLCASANEIYFEDTHSTNSEKILGQLFSLGFVEVERERFGFGSAPGSSESLGYNRILRHG